MEKQSFDEEELKEELCQYYEYILPALLDEKYIASLHKFEFKIPDMEYLIYIANYYGVDPLTESHLFWILRLACNMPLPPSWIESTDVSKPMKGDKKIYKDKDSRFENNLYTYLVFKDIENDIKIPYHPSTPFILVFLDEMRDYYKKFPEEAILTNFEKIGNNKVDLNSVKSKVQTEHLMYK